jgi:hypothetical protein
MNPSLQKKNIAKLKEIFCMGTGYEGAMGIGDSSELSYI